MKQKTIAIIDDTSSLRDLLTSFLEDRFNVDTYKRYEDLIIPNADLYFMDCEIKGGVSGIEWITSHFNFIHEDSRILMSGNVIDGQNKWQRANVKGFYINKPFNLGELDKTIDYALRYKL